MPLKILNKLVGKQPEATIRFLQPFFIVLGFIVAFSGCVSQVSYAPQSNLSFSGKYRAVATADLDNDGMIDVIGGSEIPGTVVIWYGDGAGKLIDPVFFPMRGDVRSVAVADVDEDGRRDLLISVQGESSGIMVWRNQSRDQWLQVAGPVEINNYEGVRTADINKDGHADIVAANFTTELQGGIQVWLGNGAGGWSRDIGPTINGRFMDVAVADFNEDGWPDIAGSGWGTMGALRVWFGTSFGGWAAATVLEEGNFNRLSIADIDGDGHMDVLAGTYRSGIHLWNGNGRGGFQKYDSPLDKGSFWKVLPVDGNGDARLNMLLVSSMENLGIKAFVKHPAGGWGIVENKFPTTGTFFDMTAADLNRDGLSDIVMASYGDGIKLNLGGNKAFEISTDSVKPILQKDDLSEGKVDVAENSVFKTIDGVPEYKIGAGDTLEISLWKGIEATNYTLKVRPEGKISFGLLENLYVAGLAARELDELITERLRKFIKNPRVDVLVTAHQSKYVKILGPGYGHSNRSGAGRIPLKGKTTLLEAVTESGGLHNNANLSRVRVQRKSGKSTTVDLFKAITLGDITQDVVLDDGDLVYIPIVTESENRIYVFGEVGSPGALSFTGTEIRLLDVILKAGGVSPFSTSESTKIVRGDPTHPTVISVNLEKLMKEGDLTQNIALANGDFVFVPRSFIGDINAFLQKIQPLLNLAYTPKYILDVPVSYDEAWEDAEDIIRSDEENTND